ncbi:MAG: hypothetical protein HY689_07580 [Chloroflexi bacterium]|nr:hypothetical protein [Chloroflexota bacterium]
MHLTASLTEQEILDILRREAEQAWGPQRREALDATLAGTAATIRRLLQIPLEPTDAEPDFIR